MSTEKPGNIHLALAAIMKDMVSIEKTRDNTAQGFKFRGIDDIYNELHPIFAAHGVLSIPFVDSIQHRDAGVTKNGNIQTRALVTMGYRFTASDGSFVEAKTVGEGVDSGDKATAKSLSVAHKYLLLQTFLIPTADLVDADYYSPTVDARAELALKARDKKAIEAIIAQHLDDAGKAGTEEERKRLQGLAAELRCQMADLELEPATKPEEKQTEPAKPEKTQKEPAKPWQEVECHIGKAGGSVLGHKVGDLFKSTRTEKNVASLYGYFETNIGKLTAPSEKDAALWAAVQQGYKAWQEAQTKPENTPEKPKSEPEPAAEKPKPEKTAETPEATLDNDWQGFVIESKNPSYNGRKLGELSLNEIRTIESEYLGKIDWTKATLKQKRLKAMIALALHGLLPPAANSDEPEHTAQLKSAIQESKIQPERFMAEAKKCGWISKDRQRVEDVSEDEAHLLLSDWQTVASTCETR